MNRNEFILMNEISNKMPFFSIFNDFFSLFLKSVANSYCHSAFKFRGRVMINLGFNLMNLMYRSIHYINILIHLLNRLNVLNNRMHFSNYWLYMHRGRRRRCIHNMMLYYMMLHNRLDYMLDGWSYMMNNLTNKN